MDDGQSPLLSAALKRGSLKREDRDRSIKVNPTKNLKDLIHRTRIGNQLLNKVKSKKSAAGTPKQEEVEEEEADVDSDVMNVLQMHSIMDDSKQQGRVSTATQTVRRGPYELDAVELQAIRDGRSEVLEMLRLTGLLLDTQTNEMPTEEAMEDTFTSSRAVANTTDRLASMIQEEMHTENGVSPDSLGRPKKAIGPYGQLQQAKYMMRRQEEKINEMLRKIHTANAKKDMVQKPVVKESEEMLKLKVEALVERVKRADKEFQFCESQLKEAQTDAMAHKHELMALKAKERSFNETAHIIKAVSSEAAALGEKSEVSYEDLVQYVNVTTAALEASAPSSEGPKEPRKSISIPLPPPPQVQNTVEADKLVFVMKECMLSLRGISRGMMCVDEMSMTPDEVVDSFRKTSESISERVSILRQKLDVVAEDVGIKPEEGSMLPDMDRMDFTLSMMKSKVEALIEIAVADQLIAVEESWAAETEKLNQERRRQEDEVLRLTNAITVSLNQQLKKSRLRKAKLFFERVIIQYKLGKLAKAKLRLPRWVALRLRKSYCMNLIENYKQYCVVNMEINSKTQGAWRQYHDAVVPLYSPWVLGPTTGGWIKEVEPLSGTVSSVGGLWQALEAHVQLRNNLASDSFKGISSAISTLVFCNTLVDSYLKIEREGQTKSSRHVPYQRIIEQKTKKSKGPRARSKHPQSTQGVVSEHDTPDDVSDSAEEEEESTIWDSAAYSAYHDVPMYVSGPLGAHKAEGKKGPYRPARPRHERPRDVPNRRPPSPQTQVTTFELQGTLPPLCLTQHDAHDISPCLTRLGAGLHRTATSPRRRKARPLLRA